MLDDDIRYGPTPLPALSAQSTVMDPVWCVNEPGQYDAIKRSAEVAWGNSGHRQRIVFSDGSERVDELVPNVG